MRSLLLLLLTLAYSSAFTQDVQWATEVIDFSSELTSVQYSAMQATGEPNVLPQGGENPNAWTPDRPNRDEYLILGFAEPTEIQQVVIGESYNPSAVTAVYLIDGRKIEHKVYEFEPRRIPRTGRTLNIIFNRTPYTVHAVKIEMDGRALGEYYSIDAVGISDTRRPFVIEVDLLDNLNSEISAEALSSNVNSDYKEYKPILSPDGKTLFFSRKNHPDNIGGVEDIEDIWYSELDENGEWAPAVNAGEVVNNPGPNYVSSITPDGNSAIILLGNKYLDDGKMLAGVSITQRSDSGWANPTPIEIENDYNYAEKANYYLANTKRALLMSVERDDSEGGRDLYVSFVKDDSTWTEPLNLGNVVNTAGDETAPFLAADNKTLYFSSNGFPGYGGHDIYMATRLDSTWQNWSTPQNLGSQINSDQEDVFFYLPVEGEYAYYSRGITESNSDIFRVSLPIVKMPTPVLIVTGKLTDSKTGEPIEATITYERLADGEDMGTIQSRPGTGEYEIILPMGDVYGFFTEVEGYLPISDNLDLTKYDADTKIVNRDLTLVPIEKDASIVLNNLFFDFDKASLKPESFPELDRVIEFLKKNQAVRVGLEGHTDSIGDPAYNMGLSKRRVTSVKQYLINNGLAAERTEIEWFGETKPVETNKTDEGRAKNRRVEMKIIQD